MLANIILKLAEFENEEEYPYKPRPSLAGPERCIRSLVYHGLKIPRDPLPGRAIHVFSDSRWHEELTDDWIRKSAFKLHSEQMEIKIMAPLSAGIDIILTGRIDGVVTDITGIDRLYEHKAINTFTAQRYWNNNELPLDYITQCSLYLRGLNTINPELKEGILLIKDKNKSSFMEYLIEYDYRTDATFIVHKINSQGEKVDIKESIEHITRDAFEKFALVQDYIDKKTLPKRQYERDHWRCEYCGWGNICWQGWEKEFEELKTDLVLPNEFADTVRLYQELGAQAKETNDHRNEIKAEILKYLREADAREGRAGEYVVQLQLQHRKGFTVQPTTIEKLQVTKIEKGGQP